MHRAKAQHDAHLRVVETADTAETKTNDQQDNDALADDRNHPQCVEHPLQSGAVRLWFVTH